MKFRVILGSVLYLCIKQYLPTSFSIIKVGQKRFRSFCGHLMLAKCGEMLTSKERPQSVERLSLEMILALALMHPQGENVSLEMTS